MTTVALFFILHMKITNDGCLNLMLAVLDRARLDYIFGDPYECHNIEGFIKSDHGRFFLAGTDISAEAIINNWKDQRYHEFWRLTHNCKRCILKQSKAKDREKCIHEQEGHYTAPKICLLEERYKDGLTNPNKTGHINHSVEVVKGD